VTGGLVVLAVGDFPRKVGDEKSRVASPADGVVEGLGGGEGLVTALVGENPETSAKETLQEGVESPQTSSHGLGSDGLGSDEVVEDVKGGGEEGDVAGDIVKTGGGGTLEAVLGDSIVNLLDCVVWDLELVAVGVEELLLGVLVSGLGVTQRRDGAVGGRTTGGVERRVVWGGSC